MGGDGFLPSLLALRFRRPCNRACRPTHDGSTGVAVCAPSVGASEIAFHDDGSVMAGVGGRRATGAAGQDRLRAPAPYARGARRSWCYRSISRRATGAADGFAGPPGRVSSRASGASDPSALPLTNGEKAEGSPYLFERLVVVLCSLVEHVVRRVVHERLRADVCRPATAGGGRHASRGVQPLDVGGFQ